MDEPEDLRFSFEKMMLSTHIGFGFKLIGWKDTPVELLLRILSLVDDRTVVVASGVCREWRDIICSDVTRLSFSWCKRNMNNLILSLVPKFTKLQVLVLRQSIPQLQDDAVEKIADYCHDLLELDLSKSFRLTDRSLYALARGCPNLVKLNISGCSAFSDTALVYLAGFCQKLQVLNLCGCVKAATDTALKAIGRSCHQLQSLNLGWCEQVGDAGVKSLAYGCPELQTVDLCGCVLITDESVIALANNCPRLRSLGLYFCQSLTDRAMYTLAHSRRQSKHDIQTPRKADGGLMNLNISQCTALTPPAVQAVCDSFPALHTCPSRLSLITSGCLNLVSVRCKCAVHRPTAVMPPLAH